MSYILLIALVSNILAVSFILISLSLAPLVPSIVLTIHMIQLLMETIFRTTLQAHSAKIFPPQLLPKVISYTNAITIFGTLIGASVGGWFIAREWLTFTIELIICFYLLAIIAVHFIDSPEATDKSISKQTGFHRQLVDGFHYLIKHRFLFRLFSMTMVGQLVYHTSIGFLSVYTIDHISQQATTYGWLDATFSIGGALAGLLGFWWFRQTKQLHALGSLMITAIGLVSLALSIDHTFIAFFGVSLIDLGTMDSHSLTVNSTNFD